MVQKLARPRGFIKSGSKSLDRFMGGGFQSGYPWLFVTDTEAEGITVSAVVSLSFSFVSKGFPSMILPTRHSWNMSVNSYRRSMPRVAEKLERAARARRLLVANLFTTPKYNSRSDLEIYIDPSTYPKQLQWEISKRLENLETSGAPIFWRLTSINDLLRSWTEAKIMEAFGPLLAWLHGKGATGVATLNRELVSEGMKKWAISLFPNVAYVETDFKQKVPHRIRVAKSINPRAGYSLKKFRITPSYQVAIS